VEITMVLFTPRRRFSGLFLGIFASLVLLSHAAYAHDDRVGDLRIVSIYAPPSVPGATSGAAYLVVENTGKEADRLLRVTTAAADSAEIHTMEVDAQGVMRMREVADVPLASGATVSMKPGQGMHIMLMGLKQPLKQGTGFVMTLEFEHIGNVRLNVVVQPKAPSPHAH
jgi:periplasmic copper chaperone A